MTWDCRGQKQRQSPFFDFSCNRCNMSTIVSIKKENGGMLVVTTRDGDGKREHYRISERAYREGCDLPVGAEADDDVTSLLSRENGHCEALRAALRIIGYSDNSESRLRTKLISKGYSREAVAYAVREVIGRGYLDEGRQIEIAVLNLANREFLGKYKIIPRLATKGYRAADISRVYSALVSRGDIDESKNAGELIARRLPNGGDRDEVNALLHKYGYRENFSDYD